MQREYIYSAVKDNEYIIHIEKKMMPQRGGGKNSENLINDVNQQFSQEMFDQGMGNSGASIERFKRLLPSKRYSSCIVTLRMR